MGLGIPKPLLAVGGIAMLDRAMACLRPNVDALLISANEPALFARPEATVLPDPETGYLGPIGGLKAAAAFCRALSDEPFRLVTVPGDTPFLPIDLVPRLVSEADLDEVQVAALSGRLQPTCAAWPRDALLSILDVELGAARSPPLRSMIEIRPHRVVAFPHQASAPYGDPFFNVNTPEDLKLARERSVSGDGDDIRARSDLPNTRKAP